MVKRAEWLSAHQYTPEMLVMACQVLEEIRAARPVEAAIRAHPLPGGGYLAKHVLVAAYRQLTESGAWQPDPTLLERIRMKPVRTLSGVTTVTVLTKPYPCPGQCIFCPDDARMPKSYLPDEPGARRGLEHNYDPYSQVASRIRALEDVGHPTDKIELLILGGTWDCYPKSYQEEFVRRCFDAMNGQEAATLEQAQTLNETALHRNVGLVIETRPDYHQPPRARPPAPPGRDQNPDGGAEPGRSHPGAQPARPHRCRHPPRRRPAAGGRLQDRHPLDAQPVGRHPRLRPGGFRPLVG